MIFETYKLVNPLVQHIESIFYHSGFKPDHSIERVVPTGHIFIIFDLSGLEYHTFDSTTLEPNGSFRDVWISGVHREYLSISTHQDAEMLVIQFKESGAYPFLKSPVHQLNNRVIGAEEIFGNSILDLRSAVISEETASDKFEKVEGWLKRQFDQSCAPPAELVDILSQLKTKPITDSSKIIASYPNSQKHLINQFKVYFGLTPKVFHRIYRFNEILKRIQDKQHLMWTDIAYEFGYSDQSHFIKEFKEFSGFNPQEFIKSEYHKEQPNFFPIDRKG